MASLAQQNRIQRVWVFKTVLDNERALQTVNSYGDKFDEHYNYDTKVANHKQVSDDDLAIVIDKRKILGFARIQTISSSIDKKVISKCPLCGSSTIDVRKTLVPRYRCNNGHSFDEPNKVETVITKFSALFGRSFVPVPSGQDSLSRLRPYYSSGYNQNMSIQRIDNEALVQFSEISHHLIDGIQAFGLHPSEGLDQQIQGYSPNSLDERDLIIQTIKVRRGQQAFRETLRKHYGDLCMISNCKILAILEAAHIAPYRGIKDNHVSNGLLLRADIHTLFDLNLIGIEPQSLCIYVHQDIESEYSMYSGVKLICTSKARPSIESLSKRWDTFLNECSKTTLSALISTMHNIVSELP